MSIGRRKVRLADESAWIFNRMVSDYEARPPYPEVLIDTVAAWAPPGARVLDVGAGLGHLALPLAARGFEVTALEPAQRMLERLSLLARERGLELGAVQGMAEAIPAEAERFGLAVVADVVHFLDSERAARDIARVLAPNGALVVVTPEFASTPFMRSVSAVMEASAPRRPRAVHSQVTELFAVAGVRAVATTHFDDATPVDPETLLQILRSVSFIGPAMNAERSRNFRERILAIPHEPVWARRFMLHAGRR